MCVRLRDTGLRWGAQEARSQAEGECLNAEGCAVHRPVRIPTRICRCMCIYVQLYGCRMKCAPPSRSARFVVKICSACGAHCWKLRVPGQPASPQYPLRNWAQIQHLSFQRLVLSKANTLTVSRMSSSRWGWRLTPTTLELYVELHFAAWPAVERAVYSCNLSCV